MLSLMSSVATSRFTAGRPVPGTENRPAPPARDTIHFGSSRGDRLLRKYHIDPEAVQVVSTGPALAGEKKEVLIRLLEAHEHALKNKALGNFSGRYLGCNMLMGDKWSLASNMENTRANVFCDERSAMVISWNEILKSLSLEKLKHPKMLEQAKNQLVVKMIVSSASEDDLTHPVPCSECQSWLATQRYVSPDTQIVRLDKDASNGQLFLNVQTVRDLLPLNESQTPSLSNQPVEQLPVEVSDRARASLQQFNLNPDIVGQLVQQAKVAYEANQTAPHSRKNTGTAVQFSTGHVTTGQRLDWTARWFMDSDLNAATQGLQANGGRVQAVAYYGEDTLPTVKNLGILAQTTWGGPDTLIIVVENDTVKVRTIQDYMTDIYISPSSHSRK